MCILLLMKKESIRSPKNLNTKEVMKSTQVLDSKLSTQPESNLLKKGCGGGRQDDVIDVEQQLSCRGAVVKDEQGGVRAGDTEAQCL